MIAIRHPLLRCATVLGALLAAGAVHAQTAWTSVGSAGVVDDADAGLVDFVQNEARVRAAAVAGSELDLRYNITAVPGFSGAGFYLMRVRFRDGGADARVRLDLRRVQTNGLSSTLLAFDSDAYAGSASYQTQQVCVGLTWDFANSAYWLETALRKNADTGQPALAMVQLVPVNSCVG